MEKIGVASLGHRRKILRAIADLENAPAAAPQVKPPEPKPPPLVAALPAATEIGAGGERRYLTVMFCDLVGSTAISAQLDAEEWRDLVGAYLDDAAAAVRDTGGHVARNSATD